MGGQTSFGPGIVSLELELRIMETFEHSHQGELGWAAAFEKLLGPYPEVGLGPLNLRITTSSRSLIPVFTVLLLTLSTQSVFVKHSILA